MRMCNCFGEHCRSFCLHCNNMKLLFFFFRRIIFVHAHRISFCHRCFVSFCAIKSICFDFIELHCLNDQTISAAYVPTMKKEIQLISIKVYNREQRMQKESANDRESAMVEFFVVPFKIVTRNSNKYWSNFTVKRQTLRYGWKLAAMKRETTQEWNKTCDSMQTR